LHLLWLEEHLGAALSGRAYSLAIQCARALQHAHGARRSRLVEELAAQDAWAWRSGTRTAGRIAARAKKIWRALDEALDERPMRNERTRRWRRARPVDLDPLRWEAWLRRRVQVLLRHKE
jgi:hypothetical protein